MCSRLEFSATTRLFAVIARPLLRQYVSSSCAHHSRPPIEVKLVRRARLREVMKPGSGAMRVAVDCSVDRVYKMSEKELRKLAKQIQFMYSLISSWPHPPPRLILTGLESGGRVENAFKQYIPGYNDYVLERTSQPHFMYFDPKDILYLNPYATDVLQEVKSDRVFVLGGVVDLRLTKELTETLAKKQQLASARLPIAETMPRGKSVGHLNLPLNTVLGILMSVHAGKRWSDAFSSFLSGRTGYV